MRGCTDDDGGVNDLVELRSTGQRQAHAGSDVEEPDGEHDVADDLEKRNSSKAGVVQVLAPDGRRGIQARGHHPDVQRQHGQQRRVVCGQIVGASVLAALLLYRNCAASVWKMPVTRNTAWFIDVVVCTLRLPCRSVIQCNFMSNNRNYGRESKTHHFKMPVFEKTESSGRLSQPSWAGLSTFQKHNQIRTKNTPLLSQSAALPEAEGSHQRFPH